MTMTTVNNVSNPAGAALASARDRVDLMGDNQDRFLTLLITQLRHQDPLNPMENEQITSQLAQLSTVQGVQQLNDTLLSLSGQMDMSQSMQAAALIGKDILVPGSKISLGSDPENPEVKTATPFGVDLMSGADTVVVNIVDGSGKVVREMQIDARAAGVYSIEWDGRDNTGAILLDGAYNIEAKATIGDGVPVAIEALRSGRVDSVAYTTQGLQLNLGLAGNYSLLDIRKIM